MQRNAWELDTWQGAGRSMKILVSPGETGTKELTVLLVEFEPGKGTAVHTHDGIEVMFVVDGETGLVPTDFDIADVLRRAKKKVVLIVNKIDGEKREPALGDCYKL